MFGSFFGFGSEPELDLKWSMVPKKFKSTDKNNSGGKALLPAFILLNLTECDYKPPYIFEIEHRNKIFRTCVGVSEFTGKRNEIVLPKWIYEQLELHDQDLIRVKPVKRELGTFAKFKPSNIEFLEVDNPKHVLENCLVNYQVLSVGDDLLLDFGDYGMMKFIVYELESKNGKEDSVYIVDVDLRVDFEEPEGFTDHLEKIKDNKNEKYKHESGDEVIVCGGDEVGLFFDN